MKLHYEVEWELNDDFIDDIVDEVEEAIKDYPDSDIDDCISEITGNNLSDLDVYDCDHFNIDTYIDDVISEVEKDTITANKNQLYLLLLLHRNFIVIVYKEQMTLEEFVFLNILGIL